MNVTPAMISAMATTIIISSNENPRFLLDVIMSLSGRKTTLSDTLLSNELRLKGEDRSASPSGTTDGLRYHRVS